MASGGLCRFSIGGCGGDGGVGSGGVRDLVRGAVGLGGAARGGEVVAGCYSGLRGRELVGMGWGVGEGGVRTVSG